MSSSGSTPSTYKGFTLPICPGWRQQRDEAGLAALSTHKRGRKPTIDPMAEKLAKLERKNAQQELRLRQAEAIIAAQKKISEILGVQLTRHEEPWLN